MRILVINPNTSAGVTARIDAAAQGAVRAPLQVTTLTAQSGPALIVTDADGRAAELGVLRAIAAYQGPIDGIVLASFGDTGAAQVRRAYPHLPVIGIAQAAFTAVKQRGGPFAIVTFAPEVTAPLRRKAQDYGLGAQLLRVASPPEALAHDPALVADALAGPLAALCRDCAQAGARSVVLGGGPLAGLAGQIAPHCPDVALIDGTQAAITQISAQILAADRA